jgi:hypothetical protein
LAFKDTISNGSQKSGSGLIFRRQMITPFEPQRRAIKRLFENPGEQNDSFVLLFYGGISKINIYFTKAFEQVFLIFES